LEASSSERAKLLLMIAWNLLWSGYLKKQNVIGMVNKGTLGKLKHDGAFYTRLQNPFQMDFRWVQAEYGVMQSARVLQGRYIR
jgi:hypothetical protein